MKLLITGGAGYVGSHVNKLLSARGHRTVVLDNLVHGHHQFVKWGRLAKLDLANSAGVAQLLAAERFDAVLHFAGYIAVGESVQAPEKYYQNNVVNTLNLLAAIWAAGLRAFIFSSSAAVYGTPRRIPLDEEHPLEPINPYGRSKAVIEQALRDFDAAHGLRSVSLRYFNAAGASREAEIGEWHEPEPHLIPLALDAAQGLRSSVKIYGGDYDTPDGTCIRDYVHVEDLALAHALALDYLADGGATDCFNLGNGRGFSVKEVIDAVRQVTGKPVAAETTARRAGDAPRLIASSEKARRVLGWRPQRDGLSDIVETAWRWHQRLRGGEMD
ncbi:MAG: UDP-glucose 4-epimerase GalE [Candidatus Edwardsbacteria bacterium]|nr:UDP-glucose 4-epimerase GalE [Candidatus Edwardsbacteria bacterium]